MELLGSKEANGGIGGVAWHSPWRPLLGHVPPPFPHQTSNCPQVFISSLAVVSLWQSLPAKEKKPVWILGNNNKKSGLKANLVIHALLSSDSLTPLGIKVPPFKGRGYKRKEMGEMKAEVGVKCQWRLMMSEGRVGDGKIILLHPTVGWAPWSRWEPDTWWGQQLCWLARANGTISSWRWKGAWGMEVQEGLVFLSSGGLGKCVNHQAQADTKWVTQTREGKGI